MLVLPYSLTNGTTADGAAAYGNDSYLRDALEAIRNSNVVTGAGLDLNTKASQHWVNPDGWFVLIPATSTGDLGALVQFSLPAAMTTIFKHHIGLKTGQKGELAMVEWYVASMTAGGGAEVPRLDCLIDGVQIAGQSIDITVGDAYYAIGTPDGRQIPVNNNSIVEWRVGKSGAGAAKIAGVLAKLQLRKEFIS